MVEPERPDDNKLKHSKDTHTVITFNTYCISIAIVTTQTLLNVMSYVQCLACYFSAM